MTSNICNARKRTLLGTYICDLAPGHETDHEDVAQHHSWPDKFWTLDRLIIAGCAVGAYVVADIAYWLGGAR
jgi:hypothetical protein